MRTFDPTVHNKIANHPDVVRSLEWKPEDHPETDGWLLFGNLTDDPANYWLLHNEAETLAMIFEWSMPGAVQMHTMSLPGTRGKVMMRDAKELLREMFVEHGAETIWGQAPLHNRQARMFNRLIGGRSCGFGHHHVAGDVEYFRNNRADWLCDHGSVPLDK
ncbi:hypothetical protein [Sphingomonas faeni]|uniref:hypothetical protein n=1 Tax=Sphingomonas faeni TaxID=185950 RepID=UPI00334FD4E7